MWRHSISISCLGIFMLAGTGPVFAGATAPDSGVHGKISISPGAPGPQKINQEAGGAPLAGVTVQLRNHAGKIVRQVAAADDGSFKMHAPAGSYTLHVQVEGFYPRCPDVDVTVRRNRVMQGDVACDSGMR